MLTNRKWQLNIFTITNHRSWRWPPETQRSQRSKVTVWPLTRVPGGQVQRSAVRCRWASSDAACHSALHTYIQTYTAAELDPGVDGWSVRLTPKLFDWIVDASHCFRRCDSFPTTIATRLITTWGPIYKISYDVSQYYRKIHLRQWLTTC